MKRQLAHRELLEFSISDLGNRVKEVRYHNRRCLEAFLMRCQNESFLDPKAALPLLFEAPEYIERCRKGLGRDFSKYQIRGRGILATGLTLLGSYEMAAMAFKWSHSVDCPDDFELAALDSRQAVFEAYRGNWQASLRLANRAVEVFSQDTGTTRDDRSLPTSLSVRALVRLTAYQNGIDSDLEQAASDYLRCLAQAPPHLRRTRLSAVSGMGSIAVSIWFADKPTRIDPRAVVNSLIQFRKELRRETIPIESVVDSKARWVLGLAIRQLVGGLSPVVEAHLRDALSVLQRIGAPTDVAELLLDLQWCLVSEGRWKNAIQDWKIVENLLDDVPVNWRVTLILWNECLRRRILTQEVTERVFREVRGIRDAANPGLTSDARDNSSPGW